MKVRLTKALFFLLLILISACTDIIQILDDSTRDEILVVEGKITDQPGPYIVKLSTTTSLDGLGINTLGQGAEVIIEEDTGKEEFLREVEPGTYQTDISGIQGQIGKSYRLKIILANGDQYQSTFEVLPESAEIASLSSRFIDERFVLNGVPERKIGHMISAKLVKEIGVDKFFQFKAGGIQEVEVFFDNLICPFPNNLTPICYAVRDPLRSKVEIFDDTDVATSNYSVDVVFIPVEQKRRYIAKIETHSFSSEAYTFWSTIKGQLEKSGNIFDSPFPPVVGNIRNINTNVFAQGFFTTASISSNQICIDRSNAVITIQLPIACVNRDCAQVWAPASFIMPDLSFCP